MKILKTRKLFRDKRFGYEHRARYGKKEAKKNKKY